MRNLCASFVCLACSYEVHNPNHMNATNKLEKLSNTQPSRTSITTHTIK